MAELNFDATQHEPKVGGSFEPLPAGKYVMAVTESEMTPNKAATGEYLKLTFEVMDGEHQGRKMFRNLNLNHPNEKAVTMARQELSALCAAIGKTAIRDSVELHDKPMIVDVTVKAGRGDYGPSNEVREYIARGGSKPPASKPQAPADEDIPF
jgi:hypothetical protein